jgi:glycosyltransferase involved in cell wall biosynthesis
MSDHDNSQPKTLLFVVTEDWYFVSHRLPLAQAAMKAGYRVVIAARFGEHRVQLEEEGFILRPIRLRRRGASLAGETAAILELRRLYREIKPTIVHHVALKPVVFGSVAAIGLRRIAVVNAVAGLGFLFTSRRPLAKVMRPMVTVVLRVVLRRPRSVVIVQNSSDRVQLIDRGLARASQIRLIPGAGVDLDSFRVTPEAEGIPIVVFAGRLLWAKGVREFVAAAHLLKTRGVSGRFALVGEPDTENPDAVPMDALRKWEREGVVELWGRRSDMPQVLSAVHIVCLPSVYGEGVPKILLEAAASGRPVVTTDWPGCRDAIREGQTGLLVPPGDVEALAGSLETLLVNRPLRLQFGRAARLLAEREFDIKSVVASTLAIYSELTA